MKSFQYGPFEYATYQDIPVFQEWLKQPEVILERPTFRIRFHIVSADLIVFQHDSTAAKPKFWATAPDGTLLGFLNGALRLDEQGRFSFGDHEPRAIRSRYGTALQKRSASLGREVEQAVNEWAATEAGEQTLRQQGLAFNRERAGRLRDEIAGLQKRLDAFQANISVLLAGEPEAPAAPAATSALDALLAEAVSG